jgi:hypothetical protein
MKRQDQITQAAMDYCREYKTSKLTPENMALLAFSDGAQWADENPKTSTLAEVCRKKENELRTQMEYEDHRSDKTLYGQFKELLNTIGAMTGYSNFLHLSQNIKEKKSRLNVYFSINDKGTTSIHLELVKVPEE